MNKLSSTQLNTYSTYVDFLSLPHVVGRAYCSYSMSFLPSVSTIYQILIGFIQRN